MIRHTQEEDAMTATPKAQPLRRISDADLRDTRDELEGWFRKLEEWGERVRDDIMSLEDAVIDLGNSKPIGNRPFRREGRPPPRYNQKNPGGDPGDPPRGPW